MKATSRDMTHNTVELKRTDTWLALATACKEPSANAKTGDMVQINLLHRNANPVKALKSGAARSVCGNCPLFQNGCYVNVGQAQLALWNSWLNGNVPPAGADYLPTKPVRFGSYGDPVLLGQEMVEQIAARAPRWTGYTHQWRQAQYQWARRFFMASCETEADVLLAHSMGWRTFRATNGAPMRGEIECLADKRGATCAECGICNGTRSDADKRASVFIRPHGYQANRFAK